MTSRTFDVEAAVHKLAGSICEGGVLTADDTFALKQAQIALSFILGGDIGDDLQAFSAKVYTLALVTRRPMIMLR
jgi:hypothetical protein